MSSTKSIQVLFFRWGKNEFGIEIKHIQEVLKVERVQPVPLAPPYLNQIMNVRGRIVSIFFFNRLLKVGTETYGPESRVLLLRDPELQTGIYVDSVCSIHFVDQSSWKPVPDALSQKNVGRFLKRKVQLEMKEKSILLFDSEGIFNFLKEAGQMKT